MKTAPKIVQILLQEYWLASLPWPWYTPQRCHPYYVQTRIDTEKNVLLGQKLYSPQSKTALPWFSIGTIIWTKYKQCRILWISPCIWNSKPVKLSGVGISETCQVQFSSNNSTIETNEGDRSKFSLRSIWQAHDDYKQTLILDYSPLISRGQAAILPATHSWVPPTLTKFCIIL